MYYTRTTRLINYDNYFLYIYTSHNIKWQLDTSYNEKDMSEVIVFQ